MPNSTAEISQLYRTMLRIRLVEEHIAAEYSKQEMRCPTHLSIGQEGVAVGVCAALQDRDEVFSGHRSHAHYLAKGGNLKRMIAEMMGKAEGCCGGMGGSMHLIDKTCGFRGSVPIVGSTIPIATGLAFQHQIDKTGQVVVAFLGEGATEEGVLHESLNFASLKNLPILFACENNLYSVYSPLSVRQPAGRRVTELAKGHRIATETVDGNDVLAVHEATEKAVECLCAGEGPSFIEYTTYRWREHCGPNFDNSLGYRTEEEYATWEEKCPLVTAEKKLGYTPPSSLKDELQAEVEDAFAYARSLPAAQHEDLQSRVYA